MRRLRGKDEKASILDSVVGRSAYSSFTEEPSRKNGNHCDIVLHGISSFATRGEIIFPQSSWSIYARHGNLSALAGLPPRYRTSQGSGYSRAAKQGIGERRT